MLNVSAITLWGAGSVILALLGLFVAKKTIKPIDLDLNGDLLLAMVTIVGTLVSVLLGLLVSSSVDQYRFMESSVDAEAASIGAVFRLARGTPDKTRTVLQSLCIDYCDQVVSDEWPAMKQGHMSNRVSAIYAKLNDAIVTFRPADAGEAIVEQALVTATSKLGEHRRERIVAMNSTWTIRLLPLLLMCVVIVLLISYMYLRTGKSVLHAVLVSFVAIALGTNVGIIFLMSRPFTSDWSIEPEGFAVNAQMMRECKDTPLLNTR